MEGLQWMSLIAFPSETKTSLEWSGSENRNLFSWCCKFCCFPLCWSLSWGQAYKARENLRTRTKCEGWLVIHQPSVNFLVSDVLWLHRHIWKCSWIEQCFEWWMRERREQYLFFLFGALETCCYLKSVGFAWSWRIFFIHIIILTPWDMGMHTRQEGFSWVLWEYSQEDIYKVKKTQLRALQ